MTKSRRDRLREATMLEIGQTARRILVEEGPEAVTLRAIAREMGMTAPALYRYFDSHRELLRHLVGDVFNELTEYLHRDLKRLPKGDMSGKFLVASRSFRRWSLDHRREYALLFGAPLPGLGHQEQIDFAEECAQRFGLTFLTLFLELWNMFPFPVTPEDEMIPELREQLRRYRDEALGVDLPLGVIQAFLQCWVRLQGAVSLEVFGHLEFALSDAEPMFELMLAELTPKLGLDYRPPGQSA
ncbi:TetR/AcrR family transcriptional regulator [Actinomadura barringtoniae]|uniref:TetR/AcrR family transcriptional regulator n=1 Tax=Actinomadura barringtoniae TaxID=1427535 RepID=UPI0027DC5BDD|nr:TetR/AcrR family transcriptional regulator [Actinomadura barringtoniae]